MLVVGERQIEPLMCIGKEYYVLCPHCEVEIQFYTHAARTCAGKQGCGKNLPLDPKELMSCSKTKILYHFGYIGDKGK